ncbi:MAG: hypothetical protein ACI9XZ_002863 [Alphaproteobacteria bacterium]|jgi:hypothetical protein
MLGGSAKNPARGGVRLLKKINMYAVATLPRAPLSIHPFGGAPRSKRESVSCRAKLVVVPVMLQSNY